MPRPAPRVAPATSAILPANGPAIRTLPGACGPCHSRVTIVKSVDSIEASGGIVTGKVKLDSYADAGVLVSIDLVNELVVGQAEERGSHEAVGRLRRILAVDAASVTALRPL